MVKVREEHSFNADGTVKFDEWLSRLEVHGKMDDAGQIRRACELSWEVEQQAIASENIWSPWSSSYRTGLEMAEILAQLHLDQEAIVASILYRSVRESKLELAQVEAGFGGNIAKLVEGVLRMAAISETDTSKVRVLGQSRDQVENVRKMLLALVDDVRVALIKLAERTCAIRAVKDADESKRKRVSREVFDIYAPLAHRLGIGQIKWELEDLSFRHLQPDNYKRIAGLLDERRVDREKFIEKVIDQLREQLNRADIEAEISGRAKHIYSIWRKMHSKNIDFPQVYDVRAVRVLVPEVKDCYAALGIVHNLWRVIPNEFDDYIATPKGNGYQSLHTAVIGPDSKTFEIQIRTFAMDEEAELGVCAHWRYKEGVSEPGYRDGYEDKIAWLRQVLAWHDEMGIVGGLAEQLRTDSSIHERIYVFTPEGHVVDLMLGATPLDFAYYVHTEVGHSCAGARVNGKPVALNYQLKTGDRVEIISGGANLPSREWLRPGLGYVNTPRARARLVHWFKKQDREENVAYGRELLTKEFERLAVTDLDYEDLAPMLGYKSADELFAGVGTGSIRVPEVITVAQELPQLAGQTLERRRYPRPPLNGEHNNTYVRGIGQFSPHIASCCQPAPGDAIIGCLMGNDQVVIHRPGCDTVAHYRSTRMENLIEVHWEKDSRLTFPVEIRVEAYDRPGLLRDISTVLADEGLEVIEVSTRTDKERHRAAMTLHVEVESFFSLSATLEKLNRLNNIIEAKRYRLNTNS